MTPDHVFPRSLPTALALLLAVSAASAESPDASATNRFVITALAPDGTNLTFRAVIPPGLERVTLEMRSTLNSPWEKMTTLTPAKNGGELTITIPMPQSPTELFRLNGTVSPGSNLLSAELHYVVIPSLASGPMEAVFHFKGEIDGSDKILINHAGALWEHVLWDWPNGSVTVNGQQWNSREKNYVTSVAPNRFLPEKFSLDTAQLEVLKGRDVVALERGHNGLTVFLDDTVLGSDDYEFVIRFRPKAQKPKPTPSASARIRIAAQIDGSDSVRITTREAEWQHGTFSPPASVRLNDIPWDPTTSPVIRNEGTNSFLPSGVDFSTARIVSRKGRDLATMWAEESAILVRFADNPNGSDDYEIEIAFGE